MLAERADAWSEALLSRHSRRSYDGTSAAPEQLTSVQAVCERFRPHTDARVALVEQPGCDVFTGAIGSYGKVTGAPHLLAVIAGDGARSALHAGYTGEAAVLEATAAGLDTCWVAGFFDRDVARSVVELEAGERIVAVSPLGRAPARKSGTERTFVALAGSRQRKPLRTIAKDVSPRWPEWALGAVEAARVAPSAMNRQPWRFRFEDGALILAMDSAGQLPVVRKELDCGIAMLHAEVAARAYGMDGAWEELEDGLDLARWIAKEDPR